MGTQNSSTSELQSKLRFMRHRIIIREAVSITNFLPNVLSRMSEVELKNASIKSEGKEIKANQFLAIKNVVDCVELLGSSARFEMYNESSKNHTVRSYDGSDYSYIAFVFNKDGNIENIVGYNNTDKY